MSRIADVMNLRVVSVRPDETDGASRSRACSRRTSAPSPSARATSCAGSSPSATCSGSPAHGPALAELKIGDVMTRALLTVSPDDDAVAAARLMGEQQIRHLPVVQDGMLLGIVGIRDVLRSLVELLWREHDEAARETARELLRRVAERALSSPLPGRVAQRESARLTRGRSLVQSQPRPLQRPSTSPKGPRCRLSVPEAPPRRATTPARTARARSRCTARSRSRPARAAAARAGSPATLSPTRRRSRSARSSDATLSERQTPSEVRCGGRASHVGEVVQPASRTRSRARGWEGVRRSGRRTFGLPSSLRLTGSPGRGTLAGSRRCPGRDDPPKRLPGRSARLRRQTPCAHARADVALGRPHRVGELDRAAAARARDPHLPRRDGGDGSHRMRRTPPPASVSSPSIGRDRRPR